MISCDPLTQKADIPAPNQEWRSRPEFFDKQHVLHGIHALPRIVAINEVLHHDLATRNSISPHEAQWH